MTVGIFPANGEITGWPRACRFQNAAISSPVYWLVVLSFFKNNLAVYHALTYRNTHNFFKATCFYWRGSGSFIANSWRVTTRNSLWTPGNTGLGMRAWLNSVVQSLPKPTSLKNYPYLNADPLTENVPSERAGEAHDRCLSQIRCEPQQILASTKGRFSMIRIHSP